MGKHDEELKEMGAIARALDRMPSEEARFRALAFFVGRWSPEAADTLYNASAIARARAKDTAAP